MASLPTDFEMAHEPRDVDFSAAGRGVWLVKVPKYLSEQWKSCPSGKEVGKLRITKSKAHGKKPDIVFSTIDLSKTTTNTQTSGQPSTSTVTARSGVSALKPPITGAGGVAASTSSLAGSVRNHKFLVTNVGGQNLVVMSQIKTEVSNKDPTGERICVEGKVLQRAECHPIVDANYRQFKKEQVQAHNTPKRQIQFLDGIVQSYKPVSDHFNNMEERKSKKVEAKRSRAEKDKVMDVLFNAFEKHQFYNVKDLVGITKQPVPYLKEILKEICNYNMTAPHKNMWELKPEFRHYKQHDEAT